MGNSIVQLDCKWNEVETTSELIKSQYKDSEASFIFNKSTGEVYTYSDFYEKLMLVNAIEERDTGKNVFRSTIANNKLKMAYEFTSAGEYLGFDNSGKHEVNLEDLTIKSTGVGVGGDKYTSTGTCKYGRPKSTEVFQDKEKPT